MGAACAGRRDWNSRRSLKRAVLGGLGLTIVVLAPGCSIVDQYVVDTAVIPYKGYPTASAPPPLNLATYEFPGGTPGGTKTAYQLVVAASSNAANGGKTEIATAKLLRNRLTAAMLQRSAHICTYHKAAIIANSSTANFIAGIAAASLSATAAIVTGGVSTALSTASTLATTTRAEFNAEFYRNYFAAAIVKEIEELRKDGKQAILNKYDQKTTIYPIDLAVIDVSNYHLTCSFYAGVVALTDRRDKRHLSDQCEIDDEVTKLAENVDKIAKKYADLVVKRMAEEKKKVADTKYVMVSYTARFKAYDDRMRLINMRILNLHAMSLNADKCAKPVKSSPSVAPPQVVDETALTAFADAIRDSVFEYKGAEFAVGEATADTNNNRVEVELNVKKAPPEEITQDKITDKLLDVAGDARGPLKRKNVLIKNWKAIKDQLKPAQ